MKSKYNVLIIGTGNIGAFFDSPDSKYFLTHAHGFSYHKGFNLVGFVDINKKQLRKAAKKWDVKFFKSIKEAFEKENIDVVCIATTIDSHYEILKDVFNFSSKLILLEKPIAKTHNETKKIIELCNQKKIPVAVNYFRHYLPEFDNIRINIKKNKYGNFVSGIGYYGKGMLNNGSHIIDLLIYFFGNISEFKIIDKVNDFSVNDQTISSILTFENKKEFILKGVNSKYFTIFEIDFIFEKQRIRIIESGQKIEFYKIKNSKIFKGYKNIMKFSELETSFNKYMYFVVDNIYKNLTKGEKIKCDFIGASKVSELCFKILGK